jgi:hypothetical protein
VSVGAVGAANVGPYCCNLIAAAPAHCAHMSWTGSFLKNIFARKLSAAQTNCTERELSLQQQLSLKDEIIAELRSSKAALAESNEIVIRSKVAVVESRDAIIASKDAVIAELRESKKALLTAPPRSAHEQARRVAVEACNDSSSGTSGSSSNSSSSSGHKGGNAELSAHKQKKRARHAPGHAQPLEKDEVLDEISC